MAFQMLVFACVGVALEVAFTAVVDFTRTKDWRLRGQSYLWMFPIYALVPVFLSRLHPLVGGSALPVRLLVYTALVYAVEYLSGWLLRRLTGACPWEKGYLGRRWAVHGLIRLDYAPAWALACWLFETLYLRLSGR